MRNNYRGSCFNSLPSILIWRSRAKPSLVLPPCLYLPFLLPEGAPEPTAPPCIRHTDFPPTAGPLQRWPERFERAEQRAAAFSRWVSKRANLFGRMGLSHKNKADAAWTRILSPNKPASIFMEKILRRHICEYFYSQLYSNPEVIRGFLRCPLCPGGLNRSTQHFILEGKDGVWDGTKIS